MEYSMDEYWNVMVPELTVIDFNTSLVFYTEILGFSVRNQRTDPNFAYLEQGKIQIMIEQYHENGWNVAKLSPPFGLGVKFQIELSDIEPILERINNTQIKLYRDAKESWYDTGETLSGQKEFLIQDPDGYMLRFTQYLGEKTKDITVSVVL
jgi:catechol 2,3-dioxygenase-like lactoylglutathione lyase family enzyme